MKKIYSEHRSDCLEFAKIAYPWDKHLKDKMKLTGIPPHVVLLAQWEELRNEIVELKTSLVTDIGNELTRRGVGSAEFCTNLLKNFMTERFGEITKQIKNLENKVNEEEKKDDKDYMFVDESTHFATETEDLNAEQRRARDDENKKNPNR